MPIELRVPEVGESITEVEIGDWLKSAGDEVKKDEPVVTLESEKATVELPAPESGTIAKVLKQKGEKAKVGEVIALLEHNGHASQAEPDKEPQETKNRKEGDAGEPAEPQPRKVLEKKQQIDQAEEAPAPSKLSAPSAKAKTEESSSPRLSHVAPLTSADEVIPMTQLRRTVAERLVQAQNTAALLTTFNEIDMAGIVALRKQHGEAFQQRYNVKLGFMSFFVKACVDALKQFPVVNAEIRRNNIVYHNHYDIGVAVGGGKGLVVPVLRNAERLSFAEIEMAIGDFAARARENRLKVEELQGGTFTISNGGVYGSLLSTPIVNPPQSGILGMHAIQERPVAREGQVVIRPMMYIALTYDHRLVDGREAVSFLKRIREAIENPTRMLIEV